MRLPFVLVTILGCLGAGCSNPTETPSTVNTATSANTQDHSHAVVASHQGMMIELGSEEYHAEMVHTSDAVTVYILDGSAKLSVPIDAQDLTLNVVQEGQPAQYKLVASPEANDPSGRTSRFSLADANLLAHVNAAAAVLTLVVTIDGTPYRGDIPHAHDHAGHSH